ncbi:hypothetical protein Bca52824_026090 [Brassica carinata]|uniref:Uncharacterized protein n=1 Tax=Brassica carinata TaxID=52824 RepID=A0A8X7SHX5_BRACI|nr:hypothetical protein Bca52824_026090 [Brassica carinata]
MGLRKKESLSCIIKPQKMNDFDYIRIETADDDNNGTDQNVPPHCCLAECSTICYEHPHPEMYEVVVYDSYGPTTGCIIM